jgi:hypothetical protein
MLQTDLSLYHCTLKLALCIPIRRIWSLCWFLFVAQYTRNLALQAEHYVITFRNIEASLTSGTMKKCRIIMFYPSIEKTKKKHHVATDLKRWLYPQNNMYAVIVEEISKHSCRTKYKWKSQTTDVSDDFHGGLNPCIFPPLDFLLLGIKTSVQSSVLYRILEPSKIVCAVFLPFHLRISSYGRSSCLHGHK